MSKPPTVAHDVTADELVHLRMPNKRTELVRGRLVVREPVGYRHGVVAAEIARLISTYVHDHALGVVVAAETGFKLFAEPDTVRAPDVAFIGRGRAPDPAPAGFLEIAPDLVVEVMSPNDRAGEVQGKVSDWLNAGSRLVWVIDPGRRCAVVYRADGSVDLLGERDAIGGDDVLPGFSRSLAEVW